MEKLIEQLENSFEELCSKLKNEGAGLKALETFLKEFFKLNESYCKSLLSLLTHLRSQPGLASSIRTAINVLSKELEEFAETAISLSKGIQTEVISSLELFKRGFDKQSSKFIKSGNKILTDLHQHKEKATSSYNKYTNNIKQHKKAQSELEELLESAKEASASFNLSIEQKTNQISDTQEQIKKYCSEYKEAVESVNKMIENEYDKYYTILEDSMRLDKGRVDFLKDTINKCLEGMRDMGRQYLDKVTSIMSVVEYVNSESDMRLFINSLKNTGTNPLFAPMKFVEYNYSYPLISRTSNILKVDEDYFGNEKGHDPGAITVILKQAVFKLINGKVLSLAEKAMVIEQLHKPLGKHIFVNILIKIPYYTMMPYDSFKVFGELINYLLSLFLKEKNSKVEELNAVLIVGKAVHTQVDDKTVYLFSELAKHGIWQETEQWKQLILNSIETKVAEAKDIVLKRKAGVKEEQKKGLLDGFKKLFSSDIVEAHDKEMEKVLLATVGQVLTQYVFFFANLRVSFDKAKELLEHFGRKYNINLTKIYEMELSLKTSQPFKPKISTFPKDILANKKLERKLKKYNNSLIHLCIASSLPYISDVSLLRNILLVNKEMYRVMKVYVFKQLLIGLGAKVSLENRLKIWLQIVEINSFEYDYKFAKQQLQDKRFSLPKAIEELIDMDVVRSMPQLKNVDHNSLSNILKVYAYYNKRVEYCQGMNFIVGYLYLLFQDEYTTFRFFVRLVDKYNMRHLFTHDVPLLKRYFYKFDRLLYLLCPEISEYFRSENASSCLFTSGWFITLFTYSIQHTKEQKPPETLLKIWDGFLIDGWKSLFKVGIYIVKEREKEILSARFEDIMIILGGVSKSKFIQSDDENNFIKFLNKCKVTNTELEQFDCEYNEIILQTKDSGNHLP